MLWGIRAALYQYRCRVSDSPRELNSDDLLFIAQYTGQPIEVLQKHILQVWIKARSKLWVYKCVQEFTFLIPRVTRHPHYQLVQAAHLQQQAGTQLLHLDTGCCFGQDTRQLLAHGWKHDQLIAADLAPDYWNLGKELFMDQKALQVLFLAGSMTNESLMAFNRPSSTAINGLMGTISFIWAAAVLHVLSQAECCKFLMNAHSLLAQGGSVYGWTIGAKQAGEVGRTPDGKQKRWAHSMESLWGVLLQVGFSKVQVDLSDPAVWGVEHVGKHQLVMCFTAYK